MHSNTMEKNAPKLPGIQIARAIAALSIIYFHSWTILDRFPKGTSYQLPILTDYGWLGVDLFFAISGYVICLMVTKPSFQPREFLIRRAFRLYPLWLATLTTFAVLAGLWRPYQETETLRFFLYSMTLLPTNSGYHGYPFYNIGWSLQHEMLFYLLACLTVLFFRIWGLIAVLALGGLAFHLVDLPWFPGNFLMYYPEFLAGVLAFVLGKYWRYGAAIPLAIGCAAMWFFLHGGRYYVPIPLFFFIVGFANLRYHKAMKFGILLGDASYSIYLLHPLIFWIARAATLHISTVLWAEEPIRFTSIAIVMIAAPISWKFFEVPLNEIGARMSLQNANDIVADDRRLDRAERTG